MLTYKTDFLFQTFLIVSIVLYLWKSLKKSATMKNVLLLLCAFLGLSGCHAAQDGDTIEYLYLMSVALWENGMKLLVTIIVSKKE